LPKVVFSPLTDPAALQDVTRLQGAAAIAN
jgi:hypothetical protein